MDKVKWDEICQINSNSGNGIKWYRLYHHPTPYSKSEGLAGNAGEWHTVAKWQIKYKSFWKLIKQTLFKL